MGLSCWIAHKALWSPENTAVAFGARSLTYRQFEGWVAQVTGYFRQVLDVREGDRIGYLGGNSDTILALFFACARLGAIFVPLNSRLTAPQLNVMVANAEPRYLFAAPGFDDLARDCAERARVIAIGAGFDLYALDADIAPIPCDPGKDPSLPVLIAYTSGTTGTPKGALYTQDAVTFSAINSNNAWNMHRRDHILTYLPMFHMGGLLIHTLPAFHAGGCVTILESFDPGVALKAIEELGITQILAPPHFSAAFFTHENWPRTDLSSLRSVGIGSTFVAPEIMQGWFDRGVPTQQNYGLTEAVPVLSASYEHHKRKSHTQGMPVLYCQARVMDEHMSRMPPGEPGEICIRGRSVFSGYWRNDKANAQAFQDGWFKTGDIAFTDDDGYFNIVDRKKNIVIVGSSNVYPADVEKVLEAAPQVAEAAVVGVPDAQTGEALVACVRPSDPGWADAATVRALCHGKLAPYQHPRHVLFMHEFPRTSLGKIEKVALSELAASICS